MEITSSFINNSGARVGVVYLDIDSEKELGNKKVNYVHAYCFYKDKLVIVYAKEKDHWTPPGGGVEYGEDVKTATMREVTEESNMKVLQYQLIGYQDVYEPNRTITTHVRSVCIVEPFGPFVGDPDGDITEIKLIDPQEYKKYFDWREVGDHVMKRAIELKDRMKLDSDLGMIK